MLLNPQKTDLTLRRVGDAVPESDALLEVPSEGIGILAAPPGVLRRVPHLVVAACGQDGLCHTQFGGHIGQGWS